MAAARFPSLSLLRRVCLFMQHRGCVVDRAPIEGEAAAFINDQDAARLLKGSAKQRR